MSKRGILTLNYPVEGGIVTNWDDMERIWMHTFFNELRVAPEEHPVLLSETPLTPKCNREKCTQIMFEIFNVPALYLASSAYLALLSTGRKTGLVVDCGEQISHIVPVYQGSAINHAIKRMDMGGRNITEFLRVLLTERGYSFTTTRDKEIVKEIKEEHAYVAYNYDEEANRSEHKIQYELPDGQVIEIGKELFRCTEPFFNPSLFGVEGKAIHHSIRECISTCDPGLQNSLCQNVLLTGGSSMFPGMKERLQMELTSLGLNVQVSKVDDGRYASWVGGSMLASVYTFQDIWMTLEHYDEEGPMAVHRFCPQ
uniref:Actin n=1 Tax=Vannella robusta TaxID=1487602 RepID=A0A7S4IC87_9EUKA